jgi:hypothetical protein
VVRITATKMPPTTLFQSIGLTCRQYRQQEPPSALVDVLATSNAHLAARVARLEAGDGEHHGRLVNRLCATLVLAVEAVPLESRENLCRGLVVEDVRKTAYDQVRYANII